MLGGFVMMVIGVGLLTQIDVDTSATTITLYMVLCGLGIGPSFPLYTLAVQNAVDFRLMGQATSASQFFRQIGGTFAIAIMGTLFATTMSDRMAELKPLPVAAQAQTLHAEHVTKGPMPHDSVETDVYQHQESRRVSAAPSSTNSAVRAAFADGITLVFKMVFVLIVLAFIATLRIPNLPLRATKEAAGPPPVES
jgi:hypothetical protein